MENTISLEVKKPLYMKSAQMGGVVGAIIGLVIGVGIAVLVLILVGSLGGQTYQLVQTDIAAITNTTIKNSINNGIVNGFSALETTGKYIPLIVLGVVIAIILTLILGFASFGGGSGGRSAL